MKLNATQREKNTDVRGRRESTIGAGDYALAGSSGCCCCCCCCSEGDAAAAGTSGGTGDCPPSSPSSFIIEALSSPADADAAALLPLLSLWNLHMWQPRLFLFLNSFPQTLQLTNPDLFLCMSRMCLDRACQLSCWWQNGHVFFWDICAELTLPAGKPVGPNDTCMGNGNGT